LYSFGQALSLLAFGTKALGVAFVSVLTCVMRSEIFQDLQG
jgi:hypothetical protein